MQPLQQKKSFCCSLPIKTSGKQESKRTWKKQHGNEKHSVRKASEVSRTKSRLALNRRIILIQQSSISMWRNWAKATNVTWIVHVPDSGADVNLMDEHQFKAFQHGTDKAARLKKNDIKLQNLQTSLPVKGCFKTTVRNATCGVKTMFIVLGGWIHHHYWAERRWPD
jgi:hypothetical protein